jgi:glycosyltransferase involved in cell wall biosynthesis
MEQMQANRRRVLLVNDHLGFGGGGDATLIHEHRVLEYAGYEVYRFGMDVGLPQQRGPRDCVFRESRFRAVRKAGKFLFSPGVYQALRRVLRTVQPDLVHLHLISKYPASIFAALRGYRAVHTLHGPNLFCATAWGCLKKNSAVCELGVGIKCFLRGCIPFAQLPLHWLGYAISRPFIRRNVSLFLGPSRQICRAAEWVGLGPTRYLPLCVDKHLVAPDNLRDGEPPTVVFVGAMSVQKGPDVLLEAFRLVLDEVPDARLVYAGRGDLKDIVESRARQYGIADHVQCLGFVSHDRIQDIYARGHVFAMPSIWAEQFGLVGPEALMCGLPVVASNIGGIPEWLPDGQAGYLVPPRDEQALAERLVELLKDPARCRTFAEFGRKYVLENYSTDAFRRNVLDLAGEFAGPAVEGARECSSQCSG